MLRVTYLYHSGFLIESDHAYIVCDYYLDGCLNKADRTPEPVVPALSNESQEPYSLHKHYVGLMSTPRVNVKGVLSSLMPNLDKSIYFISTHFHNDHFQPFILKFYEAYKDSGHDIHFILSKDIYKARKNRLKEFMDVITLVDKGDSVTVGDLTLNAYGSTDVGISVGFSMDGYKIFHAGDLNNWHWEKISDENEVKEANDFYERELKFISEREGAFDVVMFPCDPRLEVDLMRGAKRFLHELKVKLLIAMHVWERPQELLEYIQSDPILSPLPIFLGSEHEDKAVTLVNNATTIWIAENSGDSAIFDEE